MQETWDALLGETLQVIAKGMQLLNPTEQERQCETLHRLQLLLTDRAVPIRGGVWLDQPEAFLFLDAALLCVERTFQGMVAAVAGPLARVVAVREALKAELASLAEERGRNP